MRLAAIDVGTNSIHMLVAQIDPEGHFRVVDRAKEMVGFGGAGLTRGRLSSSAIEQGVRTLRAFRTLADRLGVNRYQAVATSAVREARNGGELIQRVRDEVGIRVKVIPGREEARLIQLGVRHAIDLRGVPALILDVGGGSVETILVEDDRPTAMHSLKVGVARLAETFLKSDPPDPLEIKRLERHLEEQFEPVLAEVAARRVRKVVGTSGTVLSLIGIAAQQRGEHPGTRFNNLSVRAEEIARVRRLLKKLDREQRLEVKGLDAKRADMIVAGACLVAYVLKRIGAETLVACTWALREGLVIDYIDRHGRGIEETTRFRDVRRRSVARLLRHLGQDAAHNQTVARLALRLFDQMREQLGLPTEAREWLEYAALLHDVGHLIDHENHHRHSYYLIVNGNLFGFTREEVEIIGQAAQHHHRKSVPKSGAESILDEKSWRWVRSLAAILRIAEGLDRSHYGVVHDLKVTRRRGRVTIALVTAGDDAALETWEARKRTDLLERMLGAEVAIRVARGA
jgi:exopolyphosphatase/guanosine-5'-triphosphate,3'-diphosphate pyrophosphatase